MKQKTFRDGRRLLTTADFHDIYEAAQGGIRATELAELRGVSLTRAYQILYQMLYFGAIKRAGNCRFVAGRKDAINRLVSARETLGAKWVMRQAQICPPCEAE